jgi:phenylpropionate dioxygenase-like ring-hydroxylating dioxygenase large terminal subunit
MSVTEARPKSPARTVTLANYWHPIARSDEVTHQPRSYRLLGDQLVAFRDRDGVAAFKDLCIHRGTALSLGEITDGRLTCPYHGWQYDRTGACVHIPSLPPGASIPRKARAIVYQAVERYGLVWVAMDEPVAPIPGWPENAWENPEYRVLLAGTYDWISSAGRAVENAMDFSHFNFVHKGYTSLADGPIVKPHEVRETELGLEYSYDDGSITREYTLYTPFTLHDRKIQAAGRGKPGASWSNLEEVSADKPAVTLLSFVAAPVDETHTRIYQYISRNHSLDAPDSGFIENFDLVTAQDQRIVESQRPEAIPTDLKDELHLRVPDATGIAYRRLLSRISGVTPFMP